MDYTVQIAMKNKESYLQEMELYKQKKDEVVVTLIETLNISSSSSHKFCCSSLDFIQTNEIYMYEHIF